MVSFRGRACCSRDPIALGKAYLSQPFEHRDSSGSTSVRSVAIDLNADLGEGFGIWSLGDDTALLDVVTSANVACGFHAGDPVIMQRVCRQAAERGVSIGAQVSYRDLAGFGRRRIDMPPDELVADLVYQVGALRAFARAAGSRVTYLKPHGALYNAAVSDPAQAGAIVTAAQLAGGLPVLGLPGSALALAAADAGVDFVAEAFADRGYSPTGSLVPRSDPGAIHATVEAVVAQAVAIAVAHEVIAVDGSSLTVDARSICIHGDTPGAVELARAVQAALLEAGVELAAFS